MRILLLTQVAVWPADAGPKVKTLQVLRYLAQQHELVYCTFVRSQSEIEALSELETLCRLIVPVLLKRSKLRDAGFFVQSLLSGDSFLLRRDEHVEMRTVVRELLRKECIELLYVDQLNMMRFVPEAWSGPLILDEHNAVWQLVERLRANTSQIVLRRFLRREVRLLRHLEGEACRRAGQVLAVSEQDKQALGLVAGDDVRIDVIPITLDVERFTFIRQARSPQHARLLSIGTLYWPPNSEGLCWWLREGYGLLRERCPDVVYNIVGARPPRSLRKLAERMAGVRLHGYVAESTPFWRSTTLLAVPLRSGGGVRVKILEAMAMGVPIVTTSIGCEGLQVVDGRHLLIADTAEAFAAACAIIIQDRELAQAMAQNALQLVREQHDSATVLSKLDSIIARLVDR
ncbi:MAG: glycosyltransferase [Ktedonobacteraceae bacterium]|nr:glycosyltransferase [Ktedonobacteraceae bacterium]